LKCSSDVKLAKFEDFGDHCNILYILDNMKKESPDFFFDNQFVEVQNGLMKDTFILGKNVNKVKMVSEETYEVNRHGFGYIQDGKKDSQKL